MLLPNFKQIQQNLTVYHAVFLHQLITMHSYTTFHPKKQNSYLST